MEQQHQQRRSHHHSRRSGAQGEFTDVGRQQQQHSAAQRTAAQVTRLQKAPDACLLLGAHQRRHHASNCRGTQQNQAATR